MFVHRSLIDARSSALPVHPFAAQIDPEKNVSAYIWFWTLFAIAWLIFILIGIRIWLNSRRAHEISCPCRDCKPKPKIWIKQNVDPEVDSGQGVTTPDSKILRKLPSIDEEASDLISSRDEIPMQTVAQRPIGFTFDDESVVMVSSPPGINGGRGQSQGHRQTRSNSLPSNLKKLYNTKLGFDGLFHKGEKK